MSFGFGVGDILAVTQLAVKIRKRFSDAPTKLQDISYELKSLLVVLEDVEVHRDVVVKLHPSKAEDLKTIVGGSKHVLQDLDSLLTKYKNLDPNSGVSEGHRVKRMWERLIFDPSDITELRARLTSNITLLEAFVANITERHTQKSLQKLEKHIDGQERQQILDWVSADCQRHTDRFNWLVNRRESGTRRWLFESPQWQTWISDEERGTTLFCPGIPGAGKTHASAMVLERLYSIFPSINVGIAFAFCDYQHSHEDEHIDLARNLLRMILERSHAWPVELRPLYESAKRSRSEVSLDEVFTLLRISMRTRARNFLVIDAIDELHPDARDVLVPKLFELQRSTGLNMLVTSRDIQQINDSFSGALQTRIKATDEDIEKYISTHMHSVLPRIVSKSPDLQDNIKTTVIQAAGELFLLAGLHLESLKTKKTKAALQKALRDLCTGPISTNEALEVAMQRIIQQPEDLANMARQTLMILTTARRPLTANELCCALAIDLQDLEDDPGFDEDNIPHIDDVLSTCAGLVVCEKQTVSTRRAGPNSTSGDASQSTQGPTDDSLIKLAHKSISDYLSFTQSKWFPHAEPQMAAICRIFCQELEQDNIKQETPFVDYAVNHWATHSVAKDSVAPKKAIEKGLDVGTLGISRQGSFPLALKQAADEFGLRQLAIELEGKGPMGIPGLLLLWACRENNKNVLDIFLSLNFDSLTEPLDQYSENLARVDEACAITWCLAHGGHGDMYPGCSNPAPAECARETEKDRLIDEAMEMATAFDRPLMVEILLSHGASVARRELHGSTVLGTAAWRGHSNMLSFLLDLDSMEVARVFDVQKRLVFAEKDRGKRWRLEDLSESSESKPGSCKSSRSIEGETFQGRVAVTPLAGAALNGHEECVRIILDWVQKQCSGTSPDGFETFCMNSMLCAMQRGHLSIVRLLLPLIDVNSPAPGLSGYTPLHLAVLTRKTEAVKLLSAIAGFDPNVTSTNGRTPLALAARMGSKDLIQELLACGASPADPLAVMEAILEGHNTTARLLCRKYSECNPGGLCAKDDTGYSFFDRILFNCIREMANYKTVGTLQEPCIDNIEDIDVYGWSPIKNSLLIPKDYYKRLDKLGNMLLHSDIRPILGEPDHPDGEVCLEADTFFLALASRSVTLPKTLLRVCPAVVRSVDSKGRTILMSALVRGSRAAVEIILKALEEQQDNTTVNAVSEAGDSALSLAIFNGKPSHEECLLSLLSFRGLDLRPVLQEDKNGDYPLMILIMMTGRYSTLPLHVMVSEMKGIPGVIGPNVWYEKLVKIFNALRASLEHEELWSMLFQFSENQFLQTGVRLIDSLSQLPLPGCLDTCLQACPELKSQLQTPDADGMTTLMHASKTRLCNATIKFILKMPETNIGHRDAQGRTLLSHVAENLGQFLDGGVASALIQVHGQDPLEVDNNGWSPLRYAVCNGNVWQGSPYQWLLRHADAPIDWADEHGSNPLHMAIKGGSPLAIKLLLQHSSSSSWLNTTDADGLVPLAHFFSISESRYMYNFRMRFPYSGPTRAVVDVKDSVQHHNGAKEAVKLMLARPDVLPDTPDKEGKTPLWHALDSVRREYGAFASGIGSSDGGHFHFFLRSSIEALCARDDVDVERPQGDQGKTPLELAAELVEICSRGDTKQRPAAAPGDGGDGGDEGDEGAGSTTASGREQMRALVKRLRPGVRENKTCAKPAPKAGGPKRPMRKRQPRAT